MFIWKESPDKWEGEWKKKEEKYLAIVNGNDVESFDCINKETTKLTIQVRIFFQEINKNTDQKMNLLLKKIKEAPQLEELNWYLTYNDIQDIHLLKIMETLKDLSKLKSLCLAFESDKITNAGVIAMAKELVKLSNLKEINLSFLNDKITDAEAIAITKELMMSFNFQKINLYFGIKIKKETQKIINDMIKKTLEINNMIKEALERNEAQQTIQRQNQKGLQFLTNNKER